MAKKVAQGAKKENLDDLKQELDIDYHKITSEELYQRFQTHPENVSHQLLIVHEYTFSSSINCLLIVICFLILYTGS